MKLILLSFLAFLLTEKLFTEDNNRNKQIFEREER